jgi:lipoate-protein ligase B
MATYAQVENKIVINTVDADAEWIAQQPGVWIEYDEANPCSIGWEVKNGACVLPPAPPVPSLD